MNKFLLILITIVLFNPINSTAFILGGAGIPNSSPTHTVDFTAGTLPSEVTFTRASTGYYYNSSGIVTSASTNAARFDYNPNTLALNGLLIEEARTNMVIAGTVIGNGSWFNQDQTVTLNNSTAPDGTTTATLQTATATNAENFSIGLHTAAGNYAESVFVKPGTSAGILFGLSDRTANAVQIVFTFGTQTFITTGGTAGNGTVVAGSPSFQVLPNGWYRLSFVANFSGTTSPESFVVGPQISTSGSITTGGTILVWGAQDEAGAFVTSPILTPSSSQTRAQDNAIITSPLWFNATTGSFATNALVEGLNTARVSAVTSFNDTTAANDIFTLLSTTSKPEGGIIVTSTEKDSGGALSAVTANTLFKTGVVYASGANLAATGGSSDTAGTFGASTLPSGITQVTFGDNAAKAKTLNGWIQKLNYWNTALTAAQLRTATQ